MRQINEQRLQRTYDFILKFTNENQRTPTFDEILANCGQTSKSTVALDIRKLVEKGLIGKESRSGRIYIIGTNSEKRHLVPYVGRFYLEKGNVSEDTNGTYMLPNALFGHNEQQFLFRATGDSMVEKRIYDGDILVADRTAKAKDGDVVIVFVENTAVCRVFATDADGNKYLKAANRAEDPYGNRIFDMHPESGFKILGIVRNIIIRL